MWSQQDLLARHHSRVPTYYICCQMHISAWFYARQEQSVSYLGLVGFFLLLSYIYVSFFIFLYLYLCFFSLSFLFLFFIGVTTPNKNTFLKKSASPSLVLCPTVSKLPSATFLHKYYFYLVSKSQLSFIMCLPMCVSEVRCINSKDEYLPEEICISQLGSMPDSTQACNVPCHQKQCTFSDWSEWSGCSDRCNGHRMRRRAMEGKYVRVSVIL